MVSCLLPSFPFLLARLTLVSLLPAQPKINTLKLTKPSSGKKVAQTVYTIDCTKPAEDRIFDVAGFEKYLHDNMKVDGKPGQLGNLVEIARVGESLFWPRLRPSPHAPSLSTSPSERLNCIMHHSHGSSPSPKEFPSACSTSPRKRVEELIDRWGFSLDGRREGTGDNDFTPNEPMT